MLVNEKIEAKKFAHTLSKKQAEDDEKAGVQDKNWADEMGEVYESAEAPAEIHEMFDHLDSLDKNKAVFVMVDESVSDPVGPSSLSKAAGSADGAVAIVFNGPVSERTLEIASESAIATVIGTKKGKGFSEPTMSNLGLLKSIVETKLGYLLPATSDIHGRG